VSRAYSILDHENVVLKSFYADCDADAYVDAYLHAALANRKLDTFHCRLVVLCTTIIIDNPFDNAEQDALRKASTFCSAMSTLRSFRAMRTLATTIRVDGRSGIRCVLAKKLFDEGYRTRKPEKHRRRLEHVTGDFYFESDLTKTMLDFVDWMVTNEPS